MKRGAEVAREAPHEFLQSPLVEDGVTDAHLCPHSPLLLYGVVVANSD